MRALCLLLAGLTALAAGARAQEADTLAAEDGWRTALVASLAGNQSAFSNWQEGGVDALAATAALDGSFDRVVGRILTTQTLRLVYGVLRQDTLDLRKAQDVARYEVTAELASEAPLRPAAGFSVRTQFAPGYDYSPEAGEYPSLPFVPGQELKVSDAFSPLVLNQTAGVAYRPGGGLVARLGLGLKETVVGIERLRPVHGNALDQPVRVEIGVDAEVVLERAVMENVTLRSRLATFQRFGQIADEAPDGLFENVLLLEVNDLLNVRVEAVALYDADVSREVQLREVLSVGVSVGLL